MKEFILVLKGESQYDVLRKAADEIAKGLAHFSRYDVVILDANREDFTEMLFYYLNRCPKLVFCMQAIYLNFLDKDKIPFFQKIDSKVFGWIFDHPIYHQSRLENSHSENIIVACMDLYHHAYIKKFHRKQNLFFLPHGGFLGNGRNKAFKEREIELFFSGGYQSPETALSEIDSIEQKDIKELILEIIEEQKHNFRIPYHELIEAYARKMRLNYNLYNLIQFTLPRIDSYMRKYYRNNVIETLLQNGFKVSVMGNGWDEFPSINGNSVDVLKEDVSGSIEEVVAMMQNSKIVLNITNSLIGGSHERIHTAMLNGAVALSNKSLYLENLYRDREHILYYCFHEIERMAESISEVLSDPEAFRRISEAGRRYALQNDRWLHRAKKILELSGIY